MYMVMSRDQNAGRNHNVKTGNSSFEREEQSKYLGTNIVDRSSIQEEIRANLSQGMLAISLYRIFCLPVCCPKIQCLRYTEL
jgi:hypothetical protein